MEELRKIIREELAKAINQLTESLSLAKDDEQIFYNFESGRAFGINKLSQNINGLNEYYMSGYFPNSESKETWMFEIDAPYGGSQLIEIIHQFNYDESVWKMNISESSRGSNELVLIETSGPIKGYSNFIEVVNSQLQNKINPGLL